MDVKTEIDFPSNRDVIKTRESETRTKTKTSRVETKTKTSKKWS